MGKDNLLLGTGRGKLGDVVFYRTGGEQRFRTRVKPANPRSNAQIMQRVVVSTAVKFYSQVAMICDHAFQNFEGPLKNHQRYMKLNIDYLRKVALQNIDSWSPIKFKSTNLGNWTWKNSMNIGINRYQVSEGDLQSIQTTLSQTSGNNKIQLGNVINKKSDEVTYTDVANALGIQIGDQITLLLFTTFENSGYIETTKYGRWICSSDSGNPDDIVNANLNFENDGDLGVGLRPISDASTRLTLYRKTNTSEQGDDTIVESRTAWAVIVSRRDGKKWKRSTSYVEFVDGVGGPGDKEKLVFAMGSYLIDDSSSLYLNQANEGNEAETNWGDVRPRTLKVEVEESTKKKKEN